MIKAAVVFNLLGAMGMAAQNHDYPLDRPFTLKNAAPFTLELENHRQINSGKPRSYIFPRPCISESDSSMVCDETARIGFTDERRGKGIYLSPMLGYGYRYLDESVNSGEAGINLWGNSGPISFYLDARTYTEVHENFLHPSYDREFVERQDQGDSHGLAYTSYSRYRANLSYDWPWGRMTVARDAVHWGPASYGNLVFNGGAVPFNQVTLKNRIGPITVISLYGQLSVSGPGEFYSDTPTRSVYAHRYEFSPSARWTFGISEQLILFDREAPFAFVPVVPLFIAKAYSSESHNNGNIAADVSFVIPGLANVYSEFLVDDLKSPGGLFDDKWSNKWAWLAGTHFVRDFGMGKSGLILEYSRVEPWVYTHYYPRTAQSANQGVPLGNPLGPNSMGLHGMAYFSKGRYHAGLKSRVAWKGDDKGSALTDTLYEFSAAEKAFLANAEPRFSIGPSVTITDKPGRSGITLETVSLSEILLSIQYRY